MHCGRRGDLESYASATALIRMTREAMQAHPESALWRFAGLDTVEGRTVFDARDAGDAVAAAVVGQYIHHLAVGIANLVNIFFPEVVGLSGGVANQARPCWPRCAPSMSRWCSARRMPKKRPAWSAARWATARA